MLSGGSTKTARKDEDPELFWAVRGAGHCLEIVSEFLFHDQTNDIWSAQLSWSASTALDAVVNFANDLLTISSSDSAMILGHKTPMHDEISSYGYDFFSSSRGNVKRIFKP